MMDETLVESLRSLLFYIAIGAGTVAVLIVVFLFAFLWYETRRRCRFQRLRRLWVTARWGRHE